jgi:hypothetical protein
MQTVFADSFDRQTLRCAWAQGHAAGLPDLPPPVCKLQHLCMGSTTLHRVGARHVLDGQTSRIKPGRGVAG